MTPKLPYLTHTLPGIAGEIRRRLEDFFVEEQPLYRPCGEGEHIYLMVEKRGIGTPEMVDIVAEHFGVRRSSVGTAGMKDAQAVTRQVVSVHTPGKSLESFPMLQHPSASVLWADMHTNKLRTGHLLGNRFSIRIRGASMTDAPAALRVLREIEKRGLPNLFGPQRFGAKFDNHEVGRDLLLGRLRRRMPTQKRRLMLNALQSAIFNEVLTRRMLDGTMDTILPGDVAFKHDNGSVFAVDSELAASDETKARLSEFAISPSGPMWGAKMMRAAGAVDEAELAALGKFGLSLEDFAQSKQAGLVPGVRRALRVAVTDTDIEGGIDEHGTYVRVAFDLPAGAYATTVLREIMKNDA